MEPDQKPKLSVSFWQAIILIILITLVIVALFGGIIYLFTSGIQQMGLPLIVNLAIFVIISGIFAWLIKRLSDIILDLSRVWFPEDQNDE